MSRFRDPGAREAAWGRHFAKRGAAAAVTRSTRAPYPSERLADWARKYHRLPADARLGSTK